jgi:integrase
MAGITEYKTPNGEIRWRVKWRDPARRQRSKSFRRKTDATKHAKAVAVDLERGEYFDGSKGRTTFNAYVDAHYLPSRDWRASTRDQADIHFRKWIYPTLGDKPIGAITPTDLDRITVACRSAGLAPTTTEIIYVRATNVLKAAAADGVIRVAPVSTQRPRRPRKRPEDEVVPLSRGQVAELVGNVPERLEAFVWVMIGAGLRSGEAAGLTADRVDFDQLEIRIDQQLVTPGKGAPHLGPPKTAASKRTVPVGEKLAEVLAIHAKRHGPVGGDGLLFGSRDGSPLRRNVISDAWKRYRPQETEARGWHVCRHTYASALIHAGESVKVVQARLGHASADETLNTYAHLWPGSEDNTRRALDDWMA